MTEIKIAKDTPETAAIMVKIMMEVERAEKKHPHWPTCIFKQVAIVLEESGELVREVNLLDEEKSSFEKIKEEAIQTAAVAIRFLKNLAETERAYDQQGIIEYFIEGSDKPYYTLERSEEE